MSRGREQKPNFILLALLAVIVLLLFQLVGMSLGLFNSDYEVNKYAGVTLPVRAETTVKGGMALIAADDSDAPCVADACAYLRKGYARYDEMCKEALAAECVVIAKPEWALETELPLLKQYCQSGGVLIVAQLPSLTQLEQSDELRALLGIGGVLADEWTTKGTRYYKHFLLGGDVTYDKLTDAVPYFWLRTGYKILAAGLTDEPDNYEAGTVPLIWRARTENVYVYLINCDALATRNGLGILYALLTDAGQNELYPVINAQTALVQNFPYLSSENPNVLKQWYHQTGDKLLMNTLLPEVTATLSASGFPFNCTFAASLDGSLADEDARWEQLTLYIQQIVGRAGEMGISAYARDPYAAQSKLLHDLGQLRQRARGYTVTTLCAANLAKEALLPMLQSNETLSDIRTVIAPRTPGGDVDAYTYLDDTHVQLPILLDGFEVDQREQLHLHSMETALLGTMFSVDMARVLYPEVTADDWVRLCKAWSDGVSSAYYPFRKLDKLTLTETDERTRQFLNVAYEYEQRDGVYYLTTDVKSEPAYFLLRVPGRKIVRVNGGRFTELEEGAYLITAEQSETEIVTEPEKEMLYQ